MADSLNAILTTRVKRKVHEDFTAKASKQGFSTNQYLKLLVLHELGQRPPAFSSEEEIKAWLRGR